ncbi:heme ABC exporter ATP-binding protein CcmA [Pelagibacterium limicola]|uniref:heme ABC exporter ATP-binding protein CcmA n=1 Tax=Pelagibacterium limicola TaxID=2791022 RepID=UPI0018AFFF47|nr:heme ABC exporter ATP-binding protein CcmA [Pelagibacterium limicola]
MPETGLKVEDLVLVRGGQPILAGVGFELPPGEALEVRGPNGSGKSSLLLALAGLIGLQSGRIDWTGGGEETENRTLLHYLGHKPAVRAGLTVAENLSFWADVLGATRENVAEGLAAAGLAAIGGLDAGILSAGQTRRLALARLVAVPRPVWLLDEPTSALDIEGARWVGRLIAKHLSAGGIAVVATHLDIDYGDGCGARRLVLDRRA